MRPVVLISALQHHAYCPRKCALIHADGVWADNERTVHGRRAHRRVESEPARTERGRYVLRSIPLWSETLGLAGRSDVVEVGSDGDLAPVEHKSGRRYGLTADLQVCAQGLCLEEMLGVRVRRGWVWYGGTRRRVEVVFDEELRMKVVEAVGRIRATLISGVLPPAPDDERCRHCQLAHHCLPGVTHAPDRAAGYVRDEVFACGT